MNRQEVYQDIKPAVDFTQSNAWQQKVQADTPDNQALAARVAQTLQNVSSELLKQEPSLADFNQAIQKLNGAVQAKPLSPQDVINAANALLSVLDRAGSVLADDANAKAARSALGGLDILLAGADWALAVAGQADLAKQGKQLSLTSYLRYNELVNAALVSIEARFDGIAAQLKQGAASLNKATQQFNSVKQVLDAATAFIGVLGQVLAVAAKF